MAGGPQGSVHSLFSIHAFYIGDLIHFHGFKYHVHMNNSRIYFFSPLLWIPDSYMQIPTWDLYLDIW